MGVGFSAFGCILVQVIGRNWNASLLPYSKYFFMSFTAPTMLLSAMAVVLIFSKITFNSTLIKDLLQTVSSLTFGVFLLHEHELFINVVYRNKLAFLLEFGIPYSISVLLLLSIGLFLACLIVDYIRKLIFEIIKVNYITELIAVMVRKLYKSLLIKVIVNNDETN